MKRCLSAVRSAALCAALCMPTVCWSSAHPIECPANIDIKSATSAPAGWQAITPAANNGLDGIGFFSGHPSELASLVPDKTQNNKGWARDLWIFSPREPRAIWAACFYRGTTLFIAKPLAHGVKKCEVRYATTRSGARLNVSTAICE